ncbi:MAG: hypothetical protein ACLFWL_12030, partial [Candidatus Brocadiia bacterium]
HCDNGEGLGESQPFTRFCDRPSGAQNGIREPTKGRCRANPGERAEAVWKERMGDAELALCAVAPSFGAQAPG